MNLCVHVFARAGVWCTGCRSPLRFSFGLGHVGASGVFACLLFGVQAVAPPSVSPLGLAKSVLLACLKACLFCVGLFAVGFVCVHKAPRKPTQQGLSCSIAGLWLERRAKRDVESCSRARAALGKRQLHNATSKRTVNTLKEWTQSCPVGFWGCLLFAVVAGGRGSREDLVCHGALCHVPSFCKLFFSPPPSLMHCRDPVPMDRRCLLV